MQRLVDAARLQFAARGYAATTTRDIAQAAEVSETLLFRHFGSKSALFDHVIVNPFNSLAQQFLVVEGQDDRIGIAHNIKAFLAFAEENRQLMLTLAAKGAADTQDEQTAARLDEIGQLYTRHGQLIAQRCQQSGTTPLVSPDYAPRLGLGMALAAILFESWLFPKGTPDRDELVQALDAVLRQIFDLTLPARSDNLCASRAGQMMAKVKDKSSKGA